MTKIKKEYGLSNKGAELVTKIKKLEAKCINPFNPTMIPDLNELVKLRKELLEEIE